MRVGLLFFSLDAGQTARVPAFLVPEIKSNNNKTSNDGYQVVRSIPLSCALIRGAASDSFLRRLLITFANSLDPDQDRGSNSLDPECRS